MRTAKDMSNRVLYIADLLNKMEDKVRIFRLDEERKKRGQAEFSEAQSEGVIHQNLECEFSESVSPQVLAEAKERAFRLLRQGLDINEAIHRARSWVMCAVKPESNNVA